ncbi:MAG: 6-phosphogluconolactonase [Denitromonas halophila]|jgi:6-phosphogluconolactonase|nr:MAG: 6-phosphogluconolactonase [Denitromonas halophila]
MRVKQFSPEEWAVQSARLIHDAVLAASHRADGCTVMLTGGRSAARLYLAWRALPDFDQLCAIDFFFGDERCVQPDDPESNYGLAMRTLFASGVPSGCSVIRMVAEAPDREGACLHYEGRLPSKIDVLLLGVGEDGHIASLFPGGAVLNERTRKVAPVVGTKAPRERLTVTPVVIAQASSVFVLANGEAKAAVFRQVAGGADDFHALPACLVSGATWLLDTPF